MKFRKKPLAVEVMHCGEPNTPEEVAEWCNGKICGDDNIGEKVWLEINTLEGIMKANYGDYVIKGVKGEFYPCKPDVFEATYEIVEDEQTKPQYTKTLLPNIRPAVKNFAYAMESRLKKFDAEKGKSGWLNGSLDDLFSKFAEEASEFSRAYKWFRVDDMTYEAVDVANMAMMILDWIGRMLDE